MVTVPSAVARSNYPFVAQSSVVAQRFIGSTVELATTANSYCSRILTPKKASRKPNAHSAQWRRNNKKMGLTQPMFVLRLFCVSGRPLHHTRDGGVQWKLGVNNELNALHITFEVHYYSMLRLGFHNGIVTSSAGTYRVYICEKFIPHYHIVESLPRRGGLVANHHSFSFIFVENNKCLG